MNPKLHFVFRPYLAPEGEFRVPGTRDTSLEVTSTCVVVSVLVPTVLTPG